MKAKMKSPKKSITRKKSLPLPLPLLKTIKSPIKDKKEKKEKINVVFDLDETLIFSIPMKQVPAILPDWLKKFKTHKMAEDFLVVERPGLQKFLDWVEQNFRITIWSAGSPEYVDFIRKNVFGKRKVYNVFNSKDCEVSQKIYGTHFIKNLELLWDKYNLKGYGPDNTLIIDDLRKNTTPQPNNSIHSKKFISTKKESLKDNELSKFKEKLQKIKKNYEKNHEKNQYKFNLVCK
jgi:TFIIF-interacting CTD phosphatase-like protein